MRILMTGPPTLVIPLLDLLLEYCLSEDSTHDQLLQSTSDVRQKGDPFQKQYVILGWMLMSKRVQAMLWKGETRPIEEQFVETVLHANTFFMHGHKPNGLVYDDVGTDLILRRLGVCVCTLRSVFVML